MKFGRFIFILITIFSLSCDDGDIIEVSLDFDNNVEYCGTVVFYKEKNDPAETLSIQLQNVNIDDLFAEMGDATSITRTYTINGTSNRFNYRTYSSLPSNPFCNDIPPADLNVVKDDESSSGIVTLTVEKFQDDNDGIPAEFEDINGDGDLTNDDTDGDGIPNYIDIDDDGDNVLTTNEEVNFSSANGLSDARDFDGDGIPDYLDNDDDGDGVLTRDEENFSSDDDEPNPANDITNTEIGPDYLNPDVNTTVPATRYRTHTIQNTFVLTVEIANINLSNLTQTYLYFGEIEKSENERFRPDFN
ncbi:hypothetical protein [Aegicerativicinus sediminis]|uniref:hypothetical protein n=1 Tax=Aegicerativicinus sediminis TaxID=2893202 RepID=UPI001E3F2F1C|nr:hypothetical protein [Aegicerativicinus sediminis]